MMRCDTVAALRAMTSQCSGASRFTSSTPCSNVFTWISHPLFASAVAINSRRDNIGNCLAISRSTSRSNRAEVVTSQTRS